MLLDKKRNEVINMHLKLSKTFKELKWLLPSGFMKKTNIHSPRVIPIKTKNISLIDIIKKAKDEQVKNETDLSQTNKNIRYALSEENKSSKKMISNLKYYFNFPFNKYKNKMTSTKNDFSKNFIDTIYKDKIKKRYKRIPIIKKTLNNIKELTNREKTSSVSNFNFNYFYYFNNNPFMTIRKNFKGCTIDNSMLKANMCLPTLTNRLKTKLPRSEREKYGFKLENYKEDENNKTESIKKLEHKKYKSINLRKYYGNGKRKKDKKIQMTNSFLKNMKMDEPVEIKSIKKISLI